MNNKQKVFVVIYTFLIVFGISGLVSLLTGMEWWILALAIAITIGVFGAAIGILFLGAWIYGYLEKPSNLTKPSNAGEQTK